jgi:hypothetical protein
MTSDDDIRSRFLARKRIACAELALSTFLHAIEVDPDMKLPANPIPYPSSPIAVYRSPFINLCQLVVPTVQRNAQDLFLELRNHYRSVLEQDQFLAAVGYLMRPGNWQELILNTFRSSVYGQNRPGFLPDRTTTTESSARTHV